MQTRHALLILVSSVFLLALVAVDFAKVAHRKPTISQTPTNLNDAVAKLGKVIARDREIVLGETSTASPAPTLTIKQPAATFETSEKNVNVIGSISDYTATISAKLNDRFLGVVKVSSTSGEFSKELELSEGKNSIVLTAVASSGATAVASVSGTLIAPVSAGTALIYLLLFVLALVAGWGIISALKRPSKEVNTQKPPTPVKLI